jgi:hypothetical protein
MINSSSSLRKNPAGAKPPARARGWLVKRLAVNDAQQGHAARRRVRFAIICSGIFLSALTVRLLHWQDNLDGVKFDAPQFAIIDTQYKIEVRRMISEGGILFPRTHDPGDARMLNHPPGYAMLLMALYGDNFYGHMYERLKVLQIVCDSAAAALVFVIAAEFFPAAVAFIAGMLVAVSPHLAFYSVWGTPDSISVLPVLLAVRFLILAVKRPRLLTVMTAGALIGLSCWLRANAMLLAPFLAALLFALLPRGGRLRYSAALVAGMAVVVAPITIRNWVVFHHFVPVALRAGINLVEGIAEYDKEDRFGMPSRMKFILQKDVEWHGRPDYASNQWKPDGIKREQYRLARGLRVARENPFWFLSVMARRAASMLRYNDSLTLTEGADTAKVPVVSAEPSFGHELNYSLEARPVREIPPAQLIAEGKTISQQAQGRLSADGLSAEIYGDDSEYGDQFVSAPVPVKKDTDYVIRVTAKRVEGMMAVKVMTPDRRAMLSPALILAPRAEGSKSEPPKSEDPDEGGEDDAPAPAAQEQAKTLDMPFASGNRGQVLLVVSNNGKSDARPAAQVGGAQLFELGPTPHSWMRYARPAVRAIQRNLFRTAVLLPLALAGAGLMALAGKRRELLILLAVPAYYLCFQSALFTEYRYILAIHYFLFTLAAVAIYCAGAAIGHGGRFAYMRITRRD